MTQAIVGRWGKNLAIRVPLEVARSCGLIDGEPVEIAAENGDIIIRRATAHLQARREAAHAAAEIRAEREHYSLGDVSIRELLEEGRRG